MRESIQEVAWALEEGDTGVGVYAARPTSTRDVQELGGPVPKLRK